MAKSSKLRVMISSRCDDKFPLGPGGRPLSHIRRELKREIEGVEVFGRKIFDVWINEETPPQGGRWDSWDVCLQAVKDCDVLIVLSSGNSGWAKDGGDIGICHAEFMTGLTHAPGKVRLIALTNIDALNRRELLPKTCPRSRSRPSDRGREGVSSHVYMQGNTQLDDGAFRLYAPTLGVQPRDQPCTTSAHVRRYSGLRRSKIVARIEQALRECGAEILVRPDPQQPHSNSPSRRQRASSANWSATPSQPTGTDELKGRRSGTVSRSCTEAAPIAVTNSISILVGIRRR